jgi:hypothetical protein
MIGALLLIEFLSTDIKKKYLKKTHHHKINIFLASLRILNGKKNINFEKIAWDAFYLLK